MAENTDDIEASIVEYFHEMEVSGHKCGYCGSKDTSMTHGMWGHRLAGQDYQDLIDRGWRRSGKYLYKPLMNKTCCPLYTIRCEALEFKSSRSQKRVAKKMRAFLVEGKEQSRPGRAEASETTNSKQTTDPSQEQKDKPSGGVETKDKETPSVKDMPDVPKPDSMTAMQGVSGSSTAQKKKTPRPGTGADPNRPRCKKAKQLRLERKRNRLAAMAAASSMPNGSECDGDKSTASVSTTAAVADKDKVQSKLQHKSNPPHLTIEDLLKIPSDKKMAHRLEAKVVDCYPPTKEFIATFVESYSLFKKYQVAVHGDKEEELSERSFRRFLCDTPLISLDGPRGWDHKYGTFHIQYHLDGQMIMVAVVDILPTYLSSVYVYYDPDYRWLEPGVYSALKEIELVRKLNRTKPEFKYYCMGYYLHNNPKMSYKGNYSPSYLLCPETYHYVPIESAQKRLNEIKYCRLSDKPSEPERVLSFLGGVLILFEKQVIPYMLFRTYYGHDKDRVVVEYASLVGKDVSQRMFLYLTLPGSQPDEDSDD